MPLRRLSRRLSMISCVYSEFVCAEKLTKIRLNLFIGRPLRYLFIYVDFPVPEGPMRQNGVCISMDLCIMSEMRSISTVFTTMALNWLLSGIQG